MLANASPSDKLSKRLQAIFAQASISRRDMLGAMIGALPVRESRCMA